MPSNPGNEYTKGTVVVMAVRVVRVGQLAQLFPRNTGGIREISECAGRNCRLTGTQGYDINAYVISSADVALECKQKEW